MEFVTLNNGVKMPLEGFGVFQVPDAAVCIAVLFVFVNIPDVISDSFIKLQ